MENMPDNVKDNPVEKRKPCSLTVSGCIRVTDIRE